MFTPQKQDEPHSFLARTNLIRTKLPSRFRANDRKVSSSNPRAHRNTAGKLSQGLYTLRSDRLRYHPPCCSRMIWRMPLRYTQFWVFLALVSGQLTEDQKQKIVKLHNSYRSQVNPQAGNMQMMYWDDTLRQVAELYAAQCNWERNPDIVGLLGENLFMTLGPFIVEQPLGIWFKEKDNYNFNTNSCSNGESCGYYTQMVWANTAFVGCAINFCLGVPNFNTRNATILVCNYYPLGNIQGQSPYIEGTECSTCPNGTLGCVNKVCDRGSGFTSDLAAISGSSNIIAALHNLLGNSAGPTKASAATLLLAGLTAFYTRMT